MLYITNINTDDGTLKGDTYLVNLKKFKTILKSRPSFFVCKTINCV